MKKMPFIFLLIMSLFIFGKGYAEESSDMDIRLAQTASGRGREYVTDISDEWKFGGKDEDAFPIDYDDSDWETINLPHTWNVLDGADGGNNYERKWYWYRKNLRLDTPFEEKRIYLEFLGANQQTDLYVNGAHVKLSGSDLYSHRGGYTAFRYDLTDFLTAGENTIAVRVDNTLSQTTAPLTGDFNMYGGIYRRVFMIAVDAVHIDLSNYGSSGLFLTTPQVRSLEKPINLGALNIQARIVNDGKNDRTVTVTAHIDGDNAPKDIMRQMTVPAGESILFDEDTYIDKPHLWQGINYSEHTDRKDVGYRYTVTLTISDGSKVIDTISDQVGFRYFYVDKDKGFFLNGKPYPLRGVNRHQYKEGQGSALTEADHEEDFRLIMEMGANTVRLSHYPQADYVYDLCDENGIVVWTEIPLVNEIGTAKSFKEYTETQLRELIRQQYNRPSVCFWGLENELTSISSNTYYTTKELMSYLDGVVAEEDSSGRYSTQAVNKNAAMDMNDPTRLADDSAEQGWKSDLIAWNIYPGWYSSFQGTFEEIALNKISHDSRPMGFSEYGWGASTTQHELYPELGKNGLEPGGNWHPEEYQNMMHEKAIAFINAHDELWATYVWCMFDFDVDARNEGSRVAQNDKGLVTNDRKIRKDSFYLYKANWNQTEPFVRITSSRFTGRDDDRTYVKVYSNCERVLLYVNDILIGEMASFGNGVFVTESVLLVEGENTIRAVGRFGRQKCEDQCVWMYPAPSSSTELMVANKISVDTMSHIVSLNQEMTIEELKEQLIGIDHATYQIMLGEVEIKDEGTLIQPGMIVIVTAEDGITAQEYDINISAGTLAIIASGMTAYVTSNEEGNTPDKALDHDLYTYWAAEDATYPQRFMLDLGDIRSLEQIEIEWSTKRERYYSYIVEISRDGKTFELAVDRRKNDDIGAVADSLNDMLGRYVKITILSCSDKQGFAVINEIRLDSK